MMKPVISPKLQPQPLRLNWEENLPTSLRPLIRWMDHPGGPKYVRRDVVKGRVASRAWVLSDESPCKQEPDVTLM